MKVPNLREFNPTESQAKHVDDTPMLDTVAHEPEHTLKGTNTMKEYVTSQPAYGKLGATGMEG
jgi:hypothetical protein